MNGLVFNLLEEVVSAAYGDAVWGQLQAAAASRGPYVAGVDYPDEELTRLVASLAEATGRGADEVTQWFRRRALEQIALSEATDGATLREAAERASALLAEALDAGDAERRRLASTLHEGPLQTLLAVRQDVAEAAEDGSDVLAAALAGLDDAIAQIRGVVGWLHPVGLEHLGLAATLAATLRDDAAQRGIAVEVDAQEVPRGEHDAVLLAVARDVLSSCDPGAEVTVVLRAADGDSVLLLHSSEACAVPPRARSRLESVGGTLEADDGTTVARVPFARRSAVI